MDKKKVKELIEQAIIWSKQANQHSVISNLEEILKELQKSNWVSVENELPSYDEDVWIRSKKSPKNVDTAYRHKECEGGYGSDKYGFPSELEVTH